MAGNGGSDEADALSVGNRLKVLRTRRGMTRDVLGGLVGRSGSWVKAVETGRIAVPKLPMLLRLTEALQAQDLAELTGAQSVPIVLFAGPGHSRLPAVRAAVNQLVMPTDRPAPPVSDLQARLRQAWAARHAAPNHREVVGALLPGLLTDARMLASEQIGGSQRRESLAVLAEVYALAQFFTAYQPAGDLLWRVAERGIGAAFDSGDARAIGITAWLMGQAHRDSGDWDAADVVTTQAAALIQSQLTSGGPADDELAALYGALLFETGYTAARRGEIGNAWRYWDEADAIAQRLPAGYFHPVTSFSRAVMHAHAVTVAVELHQGGEGVRQAQRSLSSSIPSNPRRARHWIEQARAYRLERQHADAFHALETAYATAPETIRYNGFAREIILEDLSVRDVRRQERAGRLARDVGLLSA